MSSQAESSCTVQRGLFITFEGGEGAGKSTQVGLLRADIAAAGYSVFATREPGGDPVSERIRTLLLERPMTPEAELLLFLAARAEHVRTVIEPRLASGESVLCDRFFDSTIAYQGYGRGLAVAVVEEMNLFSTGGLRPDITFLLDLAPHTGVSRQRDGNRMEAEVMSFHERVRQGFLSVASKDASRVRILDASRSIEETHRQIWAQVEEALGAQKRR